MIVASSVATGTSAPSGPCGFTPRTAARASAPHAHAEHERRLIHLLALGAREIGGPEDQTLDVDPDVRPELATELVAQPEADLEIVQSGADREFLDFLHRDRGFGARLQDEALRDQALTHRSASSKHNERLEFLGDALIGAQVVEYIFRQYPDADEGAMTALKSEVVSRRVLARIGQRLGLDAHVRVDVASLRTFNERSRDSLRADVLEALVAAIYLDQGRDAAEAVVAREILPIVAEIHATPGESNPKGALQAHVLRQLGVLPRYEALAESGHANDRRYVVGVFAGERLLARGAGTSIKEAGRAAARAALRGELPADERPNAGGG